MANRKTSPNKGIAGNIASSLKETGRLLVGGRKTPPMGAKNPKNKAALEAAGEFTEVRR
jgi:hypothetical protein